MSICYTISYKSTSSKFESNDCVFSEKNSYFQAKLAKKFRTIVRKNEFSIFAYAARILYVLRAINFP